jgi:hypothetical protein
MSEPIKQHFIPQFLLKGFAHGKKNKAKLWTFDKKTGRTYPSSVKDSAHENQFYKAKNYLGNEVEAEQLTQHVDSMGSAVIRDIISKEELPLSTKELVDTSYFVAAQMFRVPAIRNEMEAMRQTIISKWGPNISDGNDKRTVGEYSPEDTKFSSIVFLREVPKYAKILQEKAWFLWRAPIGSAYILSDNPVVRHNHIDYRPRGNLGLTQEGIEVYFPISPHLVLSFVCPKTAAMLKTTPDGAAKIELQRKGRAILSRSESVEFVNSLQVIESERFLYASREADFQIAREMIKGHPELSKPASQRMMGD